jgi:hypothetical protein
MAYIGTSPSQGVRHRYLFTATSGQTTFSGADDDSRTLSYTDTKFMDVFLNGVLLDPNSDYTATTGTSVVLTSGASAGDLLEVIAFDSFSVFSGTFGGDVTVGGDLLVGKTSSASQTTTVGHSIESDGRLYATRSGGAPLQLSRLSTDGNIASFYKDGSTVGSIGVDSGAYLKINTSYSGLFFNGGQILPTANGSLSDGGQDLGRSATRFKDLYLSGGAFLGGTGSANYLDDYEEGAWSPTIATGTVNAGYARYLKIGAQVTLWFYLQTFSDRTSATAINIGNLPFESSGANLATGVTFHRYINSGGDSLSAYIQQSTSTLTFYSSNQNSAYVNTLHSHLGSTSSTIFVTITYRTEA